MAQNSKNLRLNGHTSSEFQTRNYILGIKESFRKQELKRVLGFWKPWFNKLLLSCLQFN